MGRGKRVAARRRDEVRRHLITTDCGNGSPCLPHMGRGWRVAARRRGGGCHHFTATGCSDGASRGGRYRDVTPSLRDAHPRCDPRFIRQTNVSAQEDLLGYRLISIHDLAAPPLDNSYHDSSDEGYVFVRERVTPGFSGVRDREALVAFQALAEYCFACSDDSSEEDYDLAREFSMVGLAVQGDDAANDAANDTADPSMNSPVELPASSATTVTPTNDAQN